MRSAVLCVVLLAAVVGCGSSDGGDGDSRRTAPAPKQAVAGSSDFVQRVDALCKRTNPRLAATRTALLKARDDARAGRASPPETFDAFVTLLRRAVATTERFRARLHAIEVPRTEASFHDELMDSIGEGISNLGRQLSAAEAQDAERLRALSVEGSVINAKSKGLIAGHGGFRFCGRR